MAWLRFSEEFRLFHLDLYIIIAFKIIFLVMVKRSKPEWNKRNFSKNLNQRKNKSELLVVCILNSFYLLLVVDKDLPGDYTSLCVIHQFFAFYLFSPLKPVGLLLRGKLSA